MKNIPSLKAEWNSVIEKKLKEGQTLDDLIVHYEDGITMTPNVVSDEVADIEHELILDTSWINMVKIAQAEDGEINRLIHTALNQGANGLWLEIDTENHLDQVLEGVMTEYLSVLVRCDHALSIDKLKFPNVRQVSQDNSSIVQLAQDEKIKTFRALRKTMDTTKTIHLEITASKDLLFEIAFYRAIRLYMQEMDIKNFMIHGRFDVDGSNELGDYDLIEKTYKTMSIIMGSADTVLTDYIGDEASRLTLNIQNILDLESSFRQVLDPTSGAYYIELLTDKILARLKK